MVRSLFVFHSKSPTREKCLSSTSSTFNERETFTQPSGYTREKVWSMVQNPTSGFHQNSQDFYQRRLGLHQRYPAQREYDRSSRYNLAGFRSDATLATLPKYLLNPASRKVLPDSPQYCKRFWMFFLHCWSGIAFEESLKQIMESKSISHLEFSHLSLFHLAFVKSTGACSILVIAAYWETPCQQCVQKMLQTV